LGIPPATTAGRVPAWLPLLLVLVAAAVLWVLVPAVVGSGSDTDDGLDSDAGAPRFTDPADGPRPGTYDPDQAVPEIQGPVQVGVVPPDRAYVSSGATEGTIRGRVLVSPGSDWPATVTLTLAPQDESRTLQLISVAAAEPDFRFRAVPFGSYRLRVQADGFQDYAVLLTLSDSTTDLYQQLPLQPDARAFGTVRDTEGRPVVGVAVTVLPVTDPPRSGIPRTARSGEDGAYEVRGLPPGDYEIFPGTLAYPLGESARILITASAREGWADLEAPAMGSALVKLVLEGGDEEQADWSSVRVEAARVGGGAGLGWTESVAVAADGTASFPALPPGDYRFQAYGGSFRRVMRPATVLTGRQTDVEVPVRPFGREGGR